MEIGKILKYKKGKAPSSTKTGNDYVIYLSPEYLRNKSVPTFIPDFSGKVEINENDFLLLWDGSNAGEFFIGKKGVLSSTMVKLLFNEDVFDRSFFYYQLKSIESYLKSQTNGSGIPHVDKEVLHSIDIQEFPKPEQCQISRILSKVDEAISQTEQLIAKYRRLKTGLLQDLLTKGIDEQGNVRSEETHAFKDSPLGRIPVEWEVETLEGLLDNIPDNMRSGPFGSALTKSEWVESGIPYLGIDNVQKERFVQVYNRHITPKKYSQLARYSVNPFDVMITIMGTVGRSCVVPEGIGQAISSKHVWTMSFDRKKYFPELISYQLNYSSWVLKAMREDTQGGVMPSINSQLLKKLKFPVPPISEQKLIAKKYATVQAFLGQLNSSLVKSKRLKTGLMQDLLSGKVRVGQLIRETADV